jgi:hypothetical protein
VRTRGQASTEYVAILLVVAALLAVVAAAAVPGVGERVVGAVRTGVCIVAGDLCRSSDAAAAGLPPCVTRARSSSEETTAEIAVVRLGERGEWQLALLSDGGAVVARLDEGEAGVTAGVGFSFSPAGIEASAGASAVGEYHGGRAWRFADARAATAFLAAATRNAAIERAPDVRWHELGSRADGWAGVAAADLAHADLAMSAGNALGLRSDGARRTLTLDLGVQEPQLDLDAPGLTVRGGKRRALVAELTWERGGLREITVRSAATAGKRLEELTGWLDLRDPENRAVAARLLRPGALISTGLRELFERMRSHGVVEVAGYEVSERRSGFSVAGKLGVALGLSRQRVASERRLVDAVAWVRGGPPQRRFDCLGV